MTIQAERPPTCDRCNNIITLTGYRATNPKDGRVVLLCKDHFKEHDPALSKQGWNIERLTPPEPVAGPKQYVKCSLGCSEAAVARQVRATPESRPVLITHCKNCDTRTCGHVVGIAPNGEHIKCDSKAMTRDDPICPKGHPLMGSES